MTKLDEIIQKLTYLQEQMAEIKNEFHATQSPTCGTEEAIRMLGLTNPRYLTRFREDGLLTKIGEKKNLRYYKSELLVLAEKIKNKELIPRLKTEYRKSA